MTDVLVAGGGRIGLSVAWRAAQRGLAVTVVDDAPGTGASGAGGVAVMGPVMCDPSLVADHLAALDGVPG